MRAWHAAAAATILAAHVAGHLVVEAFHEMMLEVSISPVMHYVEHIVGKAEALEERPVNFHAHHRREAN